MAGRHDPRGAMHVHADVDAAGQLGLAGVDADPDLDRGALSCHGSAAIARCDPDRGLDGVSGGPEDREERVALGADLGAAAGTGARG